MDRLSFIAFGFLLFLPKQSFAEIFPSHARLMELLKPSVIHLVTTDNVRYNSKNSSKNTSQNSQESQYLPDLLTKSQGNEKSLGSAVIISADGFMVTSYENLLDSKNIKAIFSKKEKIDLELIGVDKKTDIALLKLKKPRKLTPVSFADSSKVDQGDLVFVLGEIMGQGHLALSAMIAGKGSLYGLSSMDHLLLLDKPIHPLSQGGAVIDMRGRFIGMATTSTALGAFVPSNLVSFVVGELKKHKKVLRPWFGALIENMFSDEETAFLKKGDNGLYGVIITNLIVNGPAMVAGFKTGDIILSMDGKKTEDIYDFQKVLRDFKINSKVLVHIYRKAQGYLDLLVLLKEMPSTSELPVSSSLF